MNGDEAFNGPNVVPLRTILRKFLSLVENYEARRNGGLDSYDSEFQELKQFSENLKADPDHVCREGEKNVNRKKNRYKDILPYDFSRVILSDYGDVPGSDYINANFIKGASGSSAYIACQGPLPHTVNEFWRMVIECEVQVIVMACNEQESGKHKCENYWVEEDGAEREFGQVTVWLKKCRNVCPDFLVRTMRMRFINSRGESEERNVCQFHYSAWPDHGVPTKVRPLLDMVRLIRDCQTSETLPVLVHCSAGCGRTGTICAIDYVWGLLRLGRLTPEFSLFNLVRDMRSQRIAMVQTKDQYILVHRAVKELFQEQLKIIDAHPYANVDENGLPLEIRRELQEPTYETLEFKTSQSPSTYLDIIKTKMNGGVDTNTSNIIVSVCNVNTNSNSNNPSNPVLPLLLPPPSKITDVPSSPPLSSTGSGGAVASREESRKVSEEKYHSNVIAPTSVVNNKNSHSTSNGHGLQSSLSSNEDSDEKVLKGSPSTSTSPSSDNTDEPSTSSTKTSSSSNSLRSALLRKPSISKLKSFFEKTPKEDKDKDKEFKKSGSTQLSRAKSDVSTRFYAFKDFTSSFTSRAPPPPSPLTTTTAATTSSSKETAKLSVKAENVTAVTGNQNQNPANKRTDDSLISKMSATSKKPAIPISKPILSINSIKRSKSLKAPSKLTATTINYSNDLSGLTLSKSGKDLHSQNHTTFNSAHLSSSDGSGSSGFSSTIIDNPIKVCVKQVEIPKLQSVVSKSVKPEVLLATSTTASSRLAKAPSSQEYDYDIDDRSHLRQQKTMSTSSSSVFQLQQESFQPSNSLSPSAETNTPSDSNLIPVPSSRTHILLDNHNYANVIYGNSNRSASSNSNRNNHRSGSSSRSRTTEDIQNFPSSSGHNYGGGSGLKFHGKLKKCDTVNPRILAASLGYTHPGPERSSILTRSQSHVWQPEKLTAPTQMSLQQPQLSNQQKSIPVRIFSSENIYQAPLLPSIGGGHLKYNSSIGDQNSPSPSKLFSMGTSSGSESVAMIDYPVIMRKPKLTSVNPNQNHRKPIRESNSEDTADNKTFVHSVSVSSSPSPVSTSSPSFQNILNHNHNPADRDASKGFHSRESSLDKTFNSSLTNSNGNSNGQPVVRRRVPKTNPYANYPTCVTGSNSYFPYKSPKSNSNTGSSSEERDIFATSGSVTSGNNYGNYANITSDIVNSNNQRKDSNSSIPLLKPSYSGSIGNSSESSSNTATPRNSSPSTPTQSVDVPYPQLHCNNPSTLPSPNLIKQQQSATINNCGPISSGAILGSGPGSSCSQNSYKSNQKSILKEQLLQQQQALQQQQQAATATPVLPVDNALTEKVDILRNVPQLPPPKSLNLNLANNNNSNNSLPSDSTSSSPSHIPKINAVRIAVGVRERRNSFRQAVWKEAPNNSPEDPSSHSAIHEVPRKSSSPLAYNANSSNQPQQQYKSSFIDSTSTPRGNPSSASANSTSRISSLPKIHPNYEPIWPESSFYHTNPFSSSSSSSAMYSPSLQAMPVLQPSKAKLQVSTSHSNSSTFPYRVNSNVNANSSKSVQDQDNQDLNSKAMENPLLQTKVDEIKLMLAELNAPVGGIGNKTSNKTNTPASGCTTTSLKQQRSLRAPSRSQYQQGLSCFTFKKPSSYESLVDQLHQEQEQQEQELEDSDEYQPLINKTGTCSTTAAVGVDLSTSIRKVFQHHPPSTRDDFESANTSRGPHAQANDYVTLRQCRTMTNNDNSNISQSQAPFQNHNNISTGNNNHTNSRQSSSSSPEFLKKVSMNSSSSGSLLGFSTNTPVPPPRSKRGSVHNSHSKSSPTNYDRDYRSDMSKLEHPSWPTQSSSSSISQKSNLEMNHYPINNTAAHTNTTTSSDSESPRLNHAYDEYRDVQNDRNQTCNSDFQGGNRNCGTTNPTTSPKAIIRALGLFQAKAANVRSRLANWTEPKDRSNERGNSSSKRVVENGNDPPLEQSHSNGNGHTKEDVDSAKCDQAGGSEYFGSSRADNHQFPTSGTGPFLGRSKHQYL